MKTVFFLVFAMLLGSSAIAHQDSVKHIGKLEIDKKKRELFTGGDSTLSLHIDTLVMHDRAQLVFLNKKKVNITISHAVIENRAYIFGTDGKNNGTDFDLDVKFEKLGTLYILAGGRDAHNSGVRTYPNGDGGTVRLRYDKTGTHPQTADSKAPNYLRIDTRAGGYHVNPQNDLRNIYGLINSGPIGRPLGRLSQGVVYSGSPGTDGESSIKAK